MKLTKSKVGEFVPVVSTNGTYYGGFQNSLKDVGVSKFYRDRSCVVTAFTNTYLYMYQKDKSFSLEEFNRYQHYFFKKLTPHINGVPTARSLDKRVNKIRDDMNLILDSHIMTETLITKRDINKKIDFINEALSKDLPVIFINRLSRDVKLMSHHGVTITELNDMGNYHELVLSSRGNIYKVNFEVFHRQLRSYSGLIYFERKDHGILKG